MIAIDLFAGLGGSSEGARLAGVPVVWVANHWQPACDAHALNHREVVPVCQDLMQADFTLLPKHTVGMASPACQGHSKAKGKNRPHHDACRATAWAVVSCAEANREDVWIVENVAEFLKWTLYPAWKAAMEALGYAVSPHIVDAADFGVPQHRCRVFIVCTRSKAPLVLDLPKKAWVPISLSLNEAEGSWSSVRTKCANTRARIRAGRKVHGERFLIAYYGNEKGGRSVNRPLGTVTTRDRYALVEGNRMRMLGVQEYRAAMGFRADYHLPASKKDATMMLGNAVCPPVMAGILNAIKEAA